MTAINELLGLHTIASDLLAGEYRPDPPCLPEVNSSSEEQLEDEDEEDREISSIRSNIADNFFSTNLVFTSWTKSSGGPPKSIYAMRSHAESVIMAAATVSSQQASVNGEISPINLLASSITAIEVCSKWEREMEFNTEEAGAL